MIVAVPDPIPLTIPVVLPTVAFAVVLLTHVPPPAVLARVVVPPTHNVASPEEAPTAAVTVKTFVATHPPL